MGCVRCFRGFLQSADSMLRAQTSLRSPLRECQIFVAHYTESSVCITRLALDHSPSLQYPSYLRASTGDRRRFDPKQTNRCIPPCARAEAGDVDISPQ